MSMMKIFRDIGIALVVCVHLVTLATVVSSIKGENKVPYFPRLHSEAHISDAVIGCPTPDHLLEIGRLAKASDFRALQAAVIEYGCLGLMNEVSGSVDDLDGWNDFICFRPAGRVHCLWVPHKVIVDGVGLRPSMAN